MRSQSSIEFLSTYTFLFVLIGVVLSVILYITVAPSVSVPSQCAAFSGPTCSFIALYANSSAGYSSATFSIINSQSVPINITNTIVTIKGATGVGACTPSFLYPGQGSSCTTPLSVVLNAGYLVQGFYTLNAQYCNSGVHSISQLNCTYETVSYSGSFASTPLRTRRILFNVVISKGPSFVQLLPFNAISTVPNQPSNYPILQNGFWIGNVSSTGTIGYAFATAGPMLGMSYLGYKAVSFPQSVSSLNNAGVSCLPPFNSLLDIASTTLYISSATNSPVSIETSGAMEVFYKVAQTGTVWQNVFGGAGWSSQPPAQYGPNSILLSKGLYNVEVVWSNPCGSAGQVLTLGSIPN